MHVSSHSPISLRPLAIGRIARSPATHWRDAMRVLGSKLLTGPGPCAYTRGLRCHTSHIHAALSLQCRDSRREH